MDYNWDDDENNEENGETSTPTDFKPTYVLLALDVGPSMFAINDNGSSSFSQCIQGLLCKMENLLLRNTKSMKSPLGVVLATNVEENFHLIKFTDNMVENYELLKKLNSKTEIELKEQFQRDAPLELDQFLMRCQQCLVQVNADVYKRHIVFVTNDDEPTVSDEVKFRALNIAKNFPHHKLYLDVTTYKSTFDYESFYEEVLHEAGSIVKKEYLENEVSFASKVDDLLINRQVKRYMKFYPVPSDERQYIQLVQHNFVKEAVIRKNFAVRSDNGEEIIKQKIFDFETPEGTFKAYYTNGDFIEMTAEEKKKLKETTLPSGYHFQYVDNRKCGVGHFLQRPVFVELDYRCQNKQFFRYFWEYCQEESKVLVCARKNFQGGDVCFVEFIPAVVDKQRMFMVLRLPTREHINYHFTKNIKPKESSDRAKKEMSRLIDEMTIPFNPEDFYSISLHRKMAYVRSEITGEPLQNVAPMKWDGMFNIQDQVDILKECIEPEKKRPADDEEVDVEYTNNSISGYVPLPRLTTKPAKKQATRRKN